MNKRETDAMRAMIQAALRRDPVIVNGPLLDALLDRAATGDEADRAAALARIRQELPQGDDPYALRIWHRDNVLKAIRDDLLVNHRAAFSKNFMAKLIQEAGMWCRDRSTPMLPDRHPFDQLTREECAWLQATIQALLDVLKVDEKPTKWPKLGQMEDILR